MSTIKIEDIGKVDPYSELRIRTDATDDEIRAAQRRFQRLVHPDRGGSAERSKLINNCAELLLDQQLRAEYDRRRRTEQTRSTMPRSAAEAPATDPPSTGARSRNERGPAGAAQETYRGEAGYGPVGSPPQGEPGFAQPTGDEAFGRYSDRSAYTGPNPHDAWSADRAENTVYQQSPYGKRYARPTAHPRPSAAPTTRVRPPKPKLARTSGFVSAVVVLIVVGMSSALLIAQHQTSSVESRRAAVIGVWDGEYYCSQGVTGITLRLTPDGAKNIDGRFDFYAVQSNPSVPSGSIAMTGRIEDGRLVLLGSRWIDRPDPTWSLIDLEANVPDGDVTALEGEIPQQGCTWWTVHRRS